MEANALPARPSLEQYRKQSKDLLKGCKSGDPQALLRVKQQHPRLSRLTETELGKARFALADAQLVIAREHGFESWPKFAKHLRALRGTTSADAIWRSAERAVIAGDAPALAELLLQHGALFRNERPPAYVSRGPRPDYSEQDARAIIAREHEFESWGELEKHFAARERRDSPVALFEAAVDAVLTGDLTALETLVREHPELTRARSTRRHHATLLHYVGANGIEGFRQKTPANAVQVAAALLDAGADVDAVADLYGGNARPLALVATSLHPRLAGVQDALIELLLDRGASLEGGGSLVNGCLANGRGSAAELLARHGAFLDLEAAAGLGRLDAVRTYFDADGALKETATRTQVRDGFAWACEFGRTEVVAFLLRMGVAVDARLRHGGQTGLHWAAYGGQADTVELLLQRGASIDAKDETWGNTPLGWALHGWSKGETDGPRPYREVVSLLVAAGAAVKPEWLADESVRADPSMLAALTRDAKR